MERHTLADGDWIEIGHTFLRFRDALEAADNADAGDDPTAGLRTLVPAFQVELDKVRQVAARNVTVRLRGETGSGKEVIARRLHTSPCR